MLPRIAVLLSQPKARAKVKDSQYIERAACGDLTLASDESVPDSAFFFFFFWAGFYGSLSSPTLGVLEMNIGPILFQVATGDITKEVADVIVNSTSNTFTLKSGTSVRCLRQ